MVPVSDNPAYQMVIIKRINQSESQLKELEMTNITGQSTGVRTSQQYENIAEVDINKENNNSGDEDDYENVE